MLVSALGLVWYSGVLLLRVLGVLVVTHKRGRSFFIKKTQKIMVDCQLIYTENSKINKKYMLTGENIHMFPLRGILLFT